jgi:hypothetical protein
MDRNAGSQEPEHPKLIPVSLPTDEVEEDLDLLLVDGEYDEGANEKRLLFIVRGEEGGGVSATSWKRSLGSFCGKCGECGWWKRCVAVPKKFLWWEVKDQLETESRLTVEKIVMPWKRKISPLVWSGEGRSNLWDGCVSVSVSLKDTIPHTTHGADMHLLLKLLRFTIQLSSLNMFGLRTLRNGNWKSVSSLSAMRHLAAAPSTAGGLDLSTYGIKPSNNTKIYRNLSYDEIFEHEVASGVGTVVKNGTYAVDTGKFTGRSPKDKYIVESKPSSDNIWWGPVNRPMKPEVFDRLHKSVSGHLSSAKSLYVFDGYSGVNLDTRKKVSPHSSPLSLLLGSSYFPTRSASSLRSLGNITL